MMNQVKTEYLLQEYRTDLRKIIQNCDFLLNLLVNHLIALEYPQYKCGEIIVEKKQTLHSDLEIFLLIKPNPELKNLADKFEELANQYFKSASEYLNQQTLQLTEVKRIYNITYNQLTDLRKHLIKTLSDSYDIRNHPKFEEAVNDAKNLRYKRMFYYIDSFFNKLFIINAGGFTALLAFLAQLEGTNNSALTFTIIGIFFFGLGLVMFMVNLLLTSLYVQFISPEIIKFYDSYKSLSYEEISRIDNKYFSWDKKHSITTSILNWIAFAFFIVGTVFASKILFLYL